MDGSVAYPRSFDAKLFARIGRRYLPRVLTPEIGHCAQGVVEAIREIRHVDHQRQFDGLPLVKKLSQVGEGRVADRRGAPSNAVGVQDDGLVLLVE
jgi:hypothetical protein